MGVRDVLRRLGNGEEAKYERSVKRLTKLPTGDITGWSYPALAGIWQALEEYERTKEPTLVLEARHVALQLLAATEVLQERANDSLDKTTP